MQVGGVVDLGMPPAAWVGILDAFGVAVAMLAWLFLRGAGERARAVAVAVGATLVAVVLARAIGGVSGVASVIAAAGFDHDGGRRVADLVLLLAGLGFGLYLVFAGHRRIALAEEPYDEDDDELDEADEPDEADEDDDEALDTAAAPWAPWFDVAVLVLALSIPVGSGFDLFNAREGVPFHRDVTVLTALAHLWAGVLAGAPLLVVVARDELADLRVVVGSFALVALSVAVRPAWLDQLGNEFWASFALGLIAGLVAGVAFALLRPVLTADRVVAAGGAVLALAMVTLGSVLAYRAFAAENESFFRNDFVEDFVDGSDVTFPAEFSTGFPTDLVP